MRVQFPRHAIRRHEVEFPVPLHAVARFAQDKRTQRDGIGAKGQALFDPVTDEHRAKHGCCHCEAGEQPALPTSVLAALTQARTENEGEGHGPQRDGIELDLRGRAECQERERGTHRGLIAAQEAHQKQASANQVHVEHGLAVTAANPVVETGHGEKVKRERFAEFCGNVEFAAKAADRGPQCQPAQNVHRRIEEVASKGEHRPGAENLGTGRVVAIGAPTARGDERECALVLNPHGGLHAVVGKGVPAKGRHDEGARSDEKRRERKKCAEGQSQGLSVTKDAVNQSGKVRTEKFENLKRRASRDDPRQKCVESNGSARWPDGKKAKRGQELEGNRRGTCAEECGRDVAQRALLLRDQPEGERVAAVGHGQDPKGGEKGGEEHASRDYAAAVAGSVIWALPPLAEPRPWSRFPEAIGTGQASEWASFAAGKMLASSNQE